MKPECSIIDCRRPAWCRTWCRTHYTRWRRHGDPEHVHRVTYNHPPSTNVTVLDTPCREYQGSRTKRGYGRRGPGQWGTSIVHRQIWIMANGPVPGGLHVLHRCDNPPCFRLDHLFLGTQADNNRDRTRKRRSRNGSAKVTKADVAEMRRLRQDGATCKDLAVRFGLHSSHVSRITTGKRWR